MSNIKITRGSGLVFWGWRCRVDWREGSWELNGESYLGPAALNATWGPLNRKGRVGRWQYRLELGREVCSPALRTIMVMSREELSEGRESMTTPQGMNRFMKKTGNNRKPAEPAKEIISPGLHLKFTCVLLKDRNIYQMWSCFAL